MCVCVCVCVCVTIIIIMQVVRFALLWLDKLSMECERQELLFSDLVWFVRGKASK